MKHIPSALRICISSVAALAALAPRTSLATDQVCAGPGMAVFEHDAGISAVDSWGTWLRILPETEEMVAVASVENLEPCRDPIIRVKHHGEHLLMWHRDGSEILSVTEEGTLVTKLPEGDRVWAADVAFIPQERAVIAALLYRIGEEPRLSFMVDSGTGDGEFPPPFEVTGANCGMGPVAVNANSAGEVVALCQGSFTVMTGLDSYSMVTLPLDLGGGEMVAVAVEPEPTSRVSFYAVVSVTTDENGQSYDLLRIRLNSYGESTVERVLENIGYAGGDHGLAVINDDSAVYMSEEGLVYVTEDTWSTSVIYPLRPEAKLSARSSPPRVLISEYEVDLLTLTEEGWKHETLLDLGMPLSSPSGGNGDSGCSMAGVDPATGLGQALLVMLALALATAPRLARGRGTAHDGAACSPRSSRR
jgi:hypothetical protein